MVKSNSGPVWRVTESRTDGARSDRRRSTTLSDSTSVTVFVFVYVQSRRLKLEAVRNIANG